MHPIFQAPMSRAALLCGALALPMAAHADPTPGSITSVPPAVYVAPSATKAAAIVRAFVAAPSRVITLPTPTVKEMTQLKAANASRKPGAKTRPLTVGMGREMPALERLVRGSELTWLALPDGGEAARVDVRSPGAAGVRLALLMAPTDPDVTVRFMGSPAPSRIFGPYAANRIAAVAEREGAFWTPVLEGESGSIEIHAPAGVNVDGINLTLLRISHLAVAGEGLRHITEKNVRDIGLAGPCEVDVACVAGSSPALLNTAKSVAKMLFTDESGATLECTGTLLNDSVASFNPYFFSASHCLNSQTAASTLNTYWFFDAAQCNSKALPSYVLLTGGAMLLGRSEDYDWALVRLREAPPAGAQFSGWRADPVGAGELANTMHHPEGDLKKLSQGQTQGYRTFDDGSTFAQIRWSQGSTEPGSSGAGLFTYNQARGFYELRGGLFGGEASCSDQAGIDIFSRLDKALPVMRQYLTPNIANPNGEVAVVEFYNKGLDHFFISSNPAEINDLDTGVHVGWVRTGFRFLAYGDPAQAPAAATPVCRFYLKPGLGDSHFYSGDPGECAATLVKFGQSWAYESANVFWILLPDKTTGNCPQGFRPVYRFFNSPQTNHRYTAEVDVRDDLKTTPGWIAEGYGPDATIMCSPND